MVKSGPERTGSTICYGEEWARKNHQDPAIRFIATKNGQKEPASPGSTICYGQARARKSQQIPAIRFDMIKSGPERSTKTQYYNLLWPRMDQKEPSSPGNLLRPRVGQKELSRPGNTISCNQEWIRKSLQDPAVRFAMAKKVPERAPKTRQYH